MVHGVKSIRRIARTATPEERAHGIQFPVGAMFDLGAGWESETVCVLDSDDGKTFWCIHEDYLNAHAPDR